MMLVCKWMEKKHGRGWWGVEKNARFYESLEGLENPFNWIRVMPLVSVEVQEKSGYDHAGIYETSLMLALWPRSADKTRLVEPLPWYTRSARKAQEAYGKKIVKMTLAQLKEELLKR